MRRSAGDRRKASELPAHDGPAGIGKFPSSRLILLIEVVAGCARERAEARQGSTLERSFGGADACHRNDDSAPRDAVCQPGSRAGWRGQGIPCHRTCRGPPPGGRLLPCRGGARGRAAGSSRRRICWEREDHVPGRPDVTAFRRAARLHQARWREAKGHPIGSQPIKPPTDGRAARPVGSRLAFDYAVETGANLVTSGALAAAKARADDASSGTRASTTNGCGPTCCGRRRWRSTCSATWPPTSHEPTGPCTPGGRTHRGPWPRCGSPTRPAGSTPRTSTASGRSTPPSSSTSTTAPAGSWPSTRSTTNG